MKTNILFAAAEAVPFLKTGGLADVAGALPRYINKDRYDVRIVIPLYSVISGEKREGMQFIGSFYMQFQGKDNYVGILEKEANGVTYYFIDNQDYFTSDKPYLDMPGDLGRFGFFCKAALSALPTIGFRPDVIHCNDWQTGLIPVYLRNGFEANPFYRGIKTVMTIHNLKFQGIWNKKDISAVCGLPLELFTPDKLEFNGDGNLFKGGLVYADAITTVSPTYANEICTTYYGEGLHGLMSARYQSLTGILNGIDTDDFDPLHDSFIPCHYNAGSFRSKKKINKAALQKRFGLAEDPKAMVIGIVSRLTEQKGFDLVGEIMDRLCGDYVQIACLGTGESRFEDMFRYFAGKYPGKVSAQLTYNEGLARLIYAGSDAFLMPSRFEPCGLSQLISLRYGTAPIVHETGGLKDTVVPLNEYTGEGTGFSFADFRGDVLLSTVRYAEKIFFDKKRMWNRMIEAGMRQDFSWNESAVAYENLYDRLLK